MDYTTIVNELKNASLFDLYRLRIAIDQQLDNPEKIKEIKRHLKIGDQISYFDSKENRQIEATLLEFKRSNVLVRNRHDQVRWTIPFYFINLDHVDTDIHSNSQQQGLEKSQLKVGDTVGFRDRDNQERYGRIVKLNPKTASLLVDERYKWRVAYQLLFSIIDGQFGTANEYFLKNTPSITQ